MDYSSNEIKIKYYTFMYVIKIVLKYLVVTLDNNNL